MIEHHIILMENDKHRVNHFNTHFSDMIDANEISIFPAITKNTNNFIGIPKNIDINIEKKFSKIATVGQIGCALSHITLWQYLLQKDTSMAVVLEDDAIMVDDYSNELQSIIGELPKNWDFVNLFTHPKQSTRKNRYEIPGKVRLLKRIRTWGTVGYLISKNGLQKICKKLDEIGLYAPIDIVLQDFLEDLIVFNLKNDIISTVGQLTESDTSTNRLKSNVWQSNSYQNLLHSEDEKIRYNSIEPFNIYSKTIHESENPDFINEYDNYSLTMNFKQGDPKKGDKLIFEKIIDIPITFNSSNILSFIVNSSYSNYNLCNFFKYTVSINDKNLLYEKVGLYSNDNNISIILNDVQEIKLMVKLETVRDCEDWNWGENIKLTIKDIKLESTGKFYDNHLSYSSPHSIDLYSSRKQPLVSLLRELSQQESIIDVFIPGGNKGDGLIYQGAYTLFARFGIEINTFDKVSDIPKISNILIILGSGGFSKNYHTMIDVIPKLITNYQMNYIFPSTFDLSFAPVKEFISKIPENLIIFCREKKSYEGVKKLLGSERVFLDHDTAFHLDYTPWIKRSDGLVNAFRIDKESSKIDIPEDNIDISSGFHYQWKELLDEIAKYSEINTNRAHVSIAAAKMGKITNIYPSNYFKQEEIYRYSLINFENVNFTTKNELLKKREFQLMQKENLLTKLNDKNLTFNNAILNSLEFFKNNQNDIRCEVIRKLDHKVNCKKLIQNLQIIYPKDYGSFQSFNQINFDNLPDKFVLKPIWGHTNLGVFLLERNGEEFFDFHRKKSYTIEELEKEFSKEKQINSGSIMIEELLVDNCKNYKIPLDYKFYTFNGKIELIMQRCVNKGPKMHNWEFKFYDDSWNEISNPLNKSNINLDLPKPKLSADLSKVAEEISSIIPLPFVRIDLYETTDGVAFGEFTFHPGNHWLFTDYWQKKLGKAYKKSFIQTKSFESASKDLLNKIR